MKNEIALVDKIGGISLPDNNQWTDRFQIRSGSSNRLYIIAKNKKSQKWACDCPGWKRWRTCKHLIQGCGLSLSDIHGNNMIASYQKKLK